MVYFIIERISKFIQLADLNKNRFVVKHYYAKYTKNKFVKHLGFFFFLIEHSFLFAMNVN